MENNQIHDDILFLIKKEHNGYVSHQKIDDALDRASIELFNERWLSYAIDQKAQDDLGPFKVKVSVNNAASPGGLVTLPADYMHLLSATYMGYDNTLQKQIRKGIEFVNDDEIDERLESALIPVTAAKPIARWAGKKKFQVYPQAPTSLEVWYLKRPSKPVYNYTMVGRTVTYNPVGSVSFEWDDANVFKIMWKTLKALGVHLSYEAIVELSNSIDTQSP